MSLENESAKFAPKVKSQTPAGQKQAYARFDDDNSHFAVTIGAKPEEVFSFFRDFSHLPTFMKDLKEIKIIDQKRSHWVAEVKGIRAEWDAEITDERANEMIAWKSVAGAEVETSGAIFFAPATGDRGTVVSLTLDYKIPGGKLAEFFTFFTGDHPSELAFINLRRLKARIETGEVATIEGQSSGREPDSEAIVKH